MEIPAELKKSFDLKFIFKVAVAGIAIAAGVELLSRFAGPKVGGFFSSPIATIKGLFTKTPTA